MAKSLNITGNIKLMDGSTDIMSDALSISENYTENNVQDFTLAASAVDQVINFAGVSTAQLVIIVPTYNSSSTNYLTMKVNGGSEDIRMGKIAVIGGSGTNGITALTISNPDAANPVQLKIYIC